jgi:hypothetical protein
MKERTAQTPRRWATVCQKGKVFADLALGTKRCRAIVGNVSEVGEGKHGFQPTPPPLLLRIDGIANPPRNTPQV